MLQIVEKDGEKTILNLTIDQAAYRSITNNGWQLPKLKDAPNHKMDGDRKVPGVSVYESLLAIQQETVRQLVSALVSEVHEANMKLPEGERSTNPVIGTKSVKRGVVMGMWKLLTTLKMKSPTITVGDLDYITGVEEFEITIHSAEARLRPKQTHVPVIKGRVLEGTSSRVHNANDRAKLDPFTSKQTFDSKPSKPRASSAPAK